VTPPQEQTRRPTPKRGWARSGTNNAAKRALSDPRGA
jgi:hypothetical protein